MKNSTTIAGLVIGCLICGGSFLAFTQLRAANYPNNTPEHGLWVYYVTTEDANLYVPDIDIKPIPYTSNCYISVIPRTNATIIVPSMVEFPHEDNFTIPGEYEFFRNCTYLREVENNVTRVSYLTYNMENDMTIWEFTVTGGPRFSYSGFTVLWRASLSQLGFDRFEFQFTGELLYWQGDLDRHCTIAADRAKVGFILVPPFRLLHPETFPNPDETTDIITMNPDGANLDTKYYRWNSHGNQIQMVFENTELTGAGESFTFVVGAFFGAGFSMVTGSIGGFFIQSVKKKEDSE